MQTSSKDRIDRLTSLGHWGKDTLHGLLEKAATNHADRLAVADQPNIESLFDRTPLRLTYAELHSAARNLANALLAQGMKRDDIVVVQLPNVVELVVLYYAASLIGVIVSPIPVQYGSHEIRFAQQNLSARFFISAPRFAGLELANNLRQAVPETCVISFAENPISTKVSECHLLDNYRQAHQTVIDDANNILTICWTSGTTGTPKGVPRSHNMWLAVAKAEIQPCGFSTADRLLNPFPLVNMAALGGFLFPSVLLGSSLFLHHPLEPAVFLQQIQDEKITFTIAPPPLLNQLAKQPAMWQQFDFSDLRSIGSGSAPLSPSMIEVFARDYGKEIINFYGSNEGICLLANKETAPDYQARATLFPRNGQPDLPWQGDIYQMTDTRIMDIDSGEPITQAGIAGELLIKGATVFDGYWGDEQNTFTDDGYFRTGDMVEITGEPPWYYRITGRCKDIINRGGMKISPSELDTLLQGMDNIAEVAVCGYADEGLGERICACVVVAQGCSLPKVADIADFLLAKGVAKYKLPERVEPFAELPKNALAKVLRFELTREVNHRQPGKT